MLKNEKDRKTSVSVRFKKGQLKVLDSIVTELNTTRSKYLQTLLDSALSNKQGGLQNG